MFFADIVQDIPILLVISTISRTIVNTYIDADGSCDKKVQGYLHWEIEYDFST